MDLILKTPLILLFSILFSLSGFSQIEFFNQSLTQPDLKLLYAGHPNIIVVSAELDENQSINSTGSQITQIDSVTYVLTPRYSTGMDTISIRTEKEILQADYFRILNMPVATIQIGSISPVQKFVSIKTLLSEPYLKAIPNGLYINDQTIISFHLSLYDVNGELLLAFDETMGYEFTDEQIARIKSMNPGDQLEISQIKVQDSLAISRILQGYRISIK